MRVFGKFLQTFQLSRSLSCSTTTRRYSSLVCSKFNCCPTYQQNPLQVRNFASSRPFGSKSGNSKFFNRNLTRHSGKRSNEGIVDGDDTAITKDNTTNTNNISDSPNNILPVALLKSNRHNNAFAMKILLIPINLFEGDDEAAQKTLATISLIRDNAKQIEAFAENMTMDPNYSNTTNFTLPKSKEITTINNSALDSKEEATPELKDDDLDFWETDLASDKAQRDDNALYDGLERAVAKQDFGRFKSENAFDIVAWDDSKRHIFVTIPESLEAKLNKMAIASMQLAFEMNMTNIRDALLRGAASNNNDLYNVPPPKSLKDPILCLTTCLDVMPYQQKSMVPLHFNALIQGTVEIDSSKFSVEQMREIKTPEFNDYMTTIAAHICSSALQKGFPADISRMSYSTKSTSCTSSPSQNRNPHIVCVREGDKGCVSSGNVDYPMFSPLRSGSSSSGSGSGKSSSGSGKGDKPRKASSATAEQRSNDNVPLLLSPAIMGDCGARGLMSCNAYAKALVEAAKRREAMKGKKSKKSCKKMPAKAEVKPAMKEKKKSCKEQLKEDPCKAEPKEAKKPTCVKSCEDNKDSRSSKLNKEKKVCNSAAAVPEKEPPKKDKPKCEDPKPPKCTPHEPKLPCGPPTEEPAKPNKNCGAQKTAPKKEASCKNEKSETKSPCPSKDSSSAKKCASPGLTKTEKPKCGPPKKASTCGDAKPNKPCVEAKSKKDKDKDKCILPDPCKDPCEAPPKKKKPCKVEEEPPCKKIKSPCKGPGNTCKKPDPKSCKSEGASPVKSKSGTSPSPQKRNPHIVCVREGDKGCVSPGNADYPMYPGGSKSGSVSAKKDDKCGKKEDPCKTKKPDPCKEKKPCKSKQPEQKKDKCAEKKPDKCSSDKGKSKCGADKKKDKCGSDKKEKKQDKCAKKKDPCNSAEKKKEESSKCSTEDPCKAIASKQKSKCGSGAKKEKSDPCKKDGAKKEGSSCGKTPKTPKPVCQKDSKSSTKSDSSKSKSCSKGDSKSGSKKESKCGSSAKKEKKDDSSCGKKAKSTKPVCKKDSKSDSSKSKCGSAAKKEKKDDSSCGKTAKSTKPVCKKESKSSTKSDSSKSKGCSKGDSKSGSKKDDPCKPKKSYSTSALFGFNRNLFWSKYRNFSTISFASIRSFSSKKKDEEDADGKCTSQINKIPKNRKTVRRQKVDCFTDSADECVKPKCKDPSKSSCAKNKNKKENKNSTPWGIFITTCTTTLNTKKTYASQLLNRYFGTSAVYTSRYTTNQDDIDECHHGRPDYQNDMHNEVVKIIDACTVERVCENVPNFSDYDVLIRTAAVAISGSDIHVYETGGKACPGMTIGHDASGIIEKVGKCIYCLKPGDRVAIESGLSCGICDFCKRGAYNMCSQLIYNGFLSTFQVHPADLCHKIPHNLTMEEGSMTQTLALGCQACFKAHITPTTNVLVVGSSATAISAALCARAIGAKRVCITSTMQSALEASRELYGLDSVHYDCSMNFGEALEGIFCVMNDWPDVVINCSISETTMNLAVMALQPCGTCILAECEAECACFNALDVLMKNLSLVPSFRSTNMFPTALQLMQSGRAPICQLIARVFGWHQVGTAFRSAQHESNIGNKKVIVKCAEEENSKEAKT